MTEANRSGGADSRAPFQSRSDVPEILFTRILNAPRKLVFKAWTDPKHLAQWWGPHGMTNPVCDVDLRPGGTFRIVMRSADGVDYPCGGVYREIARPDRLVFTVAAYDHPAEWQDLLGTYRQKTDDGPDLQQVWTVTFEEQAGGKTKLTVRNRFESATELDAALKMGHADGVAQSLDRLEESIAKVDTWGMGLNMKQDATSTADREIKVTRVFAAPRELVFKAWTDPNQVGHWWGPTGFTLTIHEMDVRPGGAWRFIMHGPDGVDYDNEIVYVEIVQPERLVYDHGPAPSFRTTVTFGEQGNKTEITMQMLFESAALREQVVREFGAVEGMKQTLDRLAEHLATL
jgi:uncharacterized protein YndB with AHSA1/START domain